MAKLTLEELRDERENLMSRIAAARSERYPYRTTDQEISGMPVAVPAWGCCYVAAEAAYHALGGEGVGLKVMHVNHEGAPHWYLVDLTRREVKSHRGAKRLIERPIIIDPTADQFATPVPYTKGKGKGFLTLQPSKRAQALLVAAGLAVKP